MTVLAVALVALVPAAGAETTAALVKDINPAGSSDPVNLANVNGTLFFTADDGTHGFELWKSDGTAAGTVLVKDINPGSPDSFINVTGDLSQPRSFMIGVNGTLFFTADDGTNGLELWKSDGTAAGTVLVKDINPGSGDSFPWRICSCVAAPIRPAAVDGTLFFEANDGVHGSELWKSDGTAAGTVMLKDILTGIQSGFALSLKAMSGMVFFNAGDLDHGGELWKSDGTTAGTVMVKDINPFFDEGAGIGDGSEPTELTAVNGTLFFMADDGTHGPELWKSDGTAVGTVLVKDINPLTSSDPDHPELVQFTAVERTLFFIANDGIHGQEPWKSDGTSAGTIMVKDVNPGSGNSSGFCFCDRLTAGVNGTFFVVANDATHGFELWKSDGTEAGTVLVKDINPGSNGSGPDWLIDVNGTLFFAANDGESFPQLWKSDGTEAGTLLVAKAEGPLFEFNPYWLTAVSSTLFFSAVDSTHGRELWKTQETGPGPSADLSITKTDGVTTVTAGTSSGSYTITVHNAGPSDATGVTLADTWPAGFMRGTVSPSQGSCTDVGAGPDFTCALGTIASGSNATVTVGYSVPASTSGDQTNTASVSSGVSDPDTNNNSASDTDQVATGIDGDMDVIVTGPTKSVASGGSRKVFVTKVCNVGTVDVAADPADISTSRTVNGNAAGGTVTLLTNPTPMLLRPGACQRYRWEWAYGAADGPADTDDVVVYQATWNLAGDGFPTNNTDSESRTAT